MKLVSSIAGVEIVSNVDGGSRRTAQRVKCLGCGGGEVFTNAKGPIYPQEALFKFASQKGWSMDKKGRHFCPKCVEKAAMSPSEQQPRKMSPQDKRKIFREIDGCYDEVNSRYVDEYTDQSISKALGVPRKWVSDVREENFGPSGENVEIERVASLLARIDGELRQAVSRCMDAAAEAERLQNEVSDAQARLAKIRESLGPIAVAG